MECNYTTLCYMYHFQFMENNFFIHHKSYVNMSKSMYQYHSFHTPHVIQLPSNNTQKIPNLGPQFNEKSSDLNIPNTHKKKIIYLVFFRTLCLCRDKGLFVTTENSCLSHPGRGRAPKLPSQEARVPCHATRPAVSCAQSCAHPGGLLAPPAGQFPPGLVTTCESGHDPLIQGPENQFSTQLWTVHSIPNISIFDPKFLGLNIKATHGLDENHAIRWLLV